MQNIKQRIERALSEANIVVAETLIEKHRNQFELDADFYCLQGVYYYLKQELELAEKSIQQGLTLSPYHLELNYNLYEIYRSQKNYSKALESYLQVYLLQRVSGINKIEVDIDKIYKELSNEVNNAKMRLKEKAVINNQIGEVVREFNEQYIASAIKDFPIKTRDCNLFYFKDWLKENNKNYFVGVYNSILYDNIPNNIKSYLCKSEIYESIETSKLSGGKVDDETFIPLLSSHSITNLQIKQEDEETKHIQLSASNGFNYLKLKGKYDIEGNQSLIIGKPINLNRRDLNKKDLVITLFVDGLSYEYLEKEGIKELMPHTAAFFEDGITCTNVQSTAEWTLPSVAAICTGLYTTEHGVYHPNRRVGLPTHKETLFEVLSASGFTTGKIDGDWRVTPNYGYIRGVDRTIYANALAQMDACEVIDEAIKHLEIFNETNQYLWLGFMDLHKVADEISGDIIQELNLPIDYKGISNCAEQKSVNLSYSPNRVVRYRESIKRVDHYLGLLYNYIQDKYKDREIMITLISDHGQTYLSQDTSTTLTPERTKVPLMIKGCGKGVCEELISMVDYFEILKKILGLKDDKERSGILPVYFGGEKERDYTYSEKIFPGQQYEACIQTKAHRVNFKSKELMLDHGCVSLEEGSIQIWDILKKKYISDKNEEERYLQIIYNHMKKHRVYS